MNPQGGIQDQEAPIHVSNVMLIDPENNEATKVKFEVVDGKKKFAFQRKLVNNYKIGKEDNKWLIV